MCYNDVGKVYKLQRRPSSLPRHLQYKKADKQYDEVMTGLGLHSFVFTSKMDNIIPPPKK